MAGANRRSRGKGNGNGKHIRRIPLWMANCNAFADGVDPDAPPPPRPTAPVQTLRSIHGIPSDSQHAPMPALPVFAPFPQTVSTEEKPTARTAVMSYAGVLKGLSDPAIWAADEVDEENGGVTVAGNGDGDGDSGLDAAGADEGDALQPVVQNTMVAATGSGFQFNPTAAPFFRLPIQAFGPSLIPPPIQAIPQGLPQSLPQGLPQSLPQGLPQGHQQHQQPLPPVPQQPLPQPVLQQPISQAAALQNLPYVDPQPNAFSTPLPQSRQQAPPTPDRSPVVAHNLPIILTAPAVRVKGEGELLVLCANIKRYITNVFDLKITSFVIWNTQLKLPCLPYPSLRLTPAIPLADCLAEFYELTAECQRLTNYLNNDLGKERGCAAKCYELDKIVQGQMGYLNRWLKERSVEESKRIQEWRMEFFEFSSCVYRKSNRHEAGTEAGLAGDGDNYQVEFDQPIGTMEDFWTIEDFLVVDKWLDGITADDPNAIEQEVPDELRFDRQVPVWERQIEEWLAQGEEMNSSFFVRPRRPLRRAPRRRLEGY